METPLAARNRGTGIRKRMYVYLHLTEFDSTYISQTAHDEMSNFV